MAPPRGRPDPPLEHTLFEEAYRFDFFQAVRLLERLRSDRLAVGRGGPPRREAVRFRTARGLAFPASAIQRLEPPEDPNDPPVLTVAFMGLTGPLGVLPYCYSELILTRTRAGDRTLEAFLDLFNHRLIALFYRAWAKHRLAVLHERGESERFSDYLLDLIGLGLEPLRGRHEFPDAAPRYYAGIFAQRHRPVVMLEALLRDYFGLPVVVCQFEGHWLRLEPGDRSTLGVSGQHNQLGASLILGRRVWDEQGKFRLRVGPLSFEQFLVYLPDGPNFRALTQMTRLYGDGEFAFDVQLVLKAEEVPGCRLSSSPGAGPRLGRFAWLKSREFTKDAEDAVFPAEA
ncbi:MAG: type VI secretion system baseplate subunit TssG [Isosphaeraceae bacterium]|nr:type VI secretion system baseplate subunit TssG [Isosphaeraceae bacterium]